jgi:hypothetical protein
MTDFLEVGEHGWVMPNAWDFFGSDLRQQQLKPGCCGM